MKNVREPIWWIPLARRIFGWGTLVAVAMGVAAFLILGAALSVWAQLPVGMGSRESLLKVVRISAAHAASIALLGAFAGSVTAFFAPVTESQNGLKSAFLRAVLADAFRFWAFTCVLMWVTFYFVILYFYSWIHPDWIQNANFILVRVLFVLSLWRAINYVLRAAEEANRA